MQKETYFYPSSLKNIEELLWLHKSDTNFLWIYQENPAKKEEAENMMVEKLIQNPRVLNSSLDDISILKYTGKERFHFLKKNFSLKKIVLLGINDKEFGVHLQLPPYEIVKHLDYYFLRIHSPEELATIPGTQKVALAQKLNELKAI